MRPVDIKKQELSEVQFKINQWAEAKRLIAWKWLVEYLEMRYIELGTKNCDSLKDLAARNSAMREIRGIFQHIQHTYNEREVLEKEIRMFQQDEDELPDKFMNSFPVNF